MIEVDFACTLLGIDTFKYLFNYRYKLEIITYCYDYLPWGIISNHLFCWNYYIMLYL